MTFAVIMKIISYVATFAIPSVLGIVGFFKQRKTHGDEIDKHKEIERSLRSQIVDLVELQGEKNEIDRSGKQAKKDRNNLSDDDLNIAYNNQLPDIPTKRKRNRKKNT